MRFLFFLIVVVNLGFWAYGQGYFGLPPDELGRSLAQRTQVNAQAVTLGEPVLFPYQKP